MDSRGSATGLDTKVAGLAGFKFKLVLDALADFNSSTFWGSIFKSLLWTISSKAASFNF